IMHIMKEPKPEQPGSKSDGNVGLNTRHLELLNKMFAELTSTLDETELLSRAVSIIGDHFEHAVVIVNSYDEARKELVLKAASEEFCRYSKLESRLPLDSGVIGLAARERRFILVPDIRVCDFYLEKFPATRSELACPIMHGEK